MNVSASKGGKLIALTFDDGPSGYTNSLLDGLAKRNVKVTFFMVGRSASAYPKVVKRAFNEGHQIAQHTYDHPALTTKSNDQIRWQVETTDKILDGILGRDYNYLIRTPYGDCNDRVLNQIGAPNILWSIDSCDWQLLNAQKVCDKIVSSAFDGAIILVHDIHKTSIPGALEAIDILLARGYEFVTVNELFRRRGTELNNGKIYYSCKPNGTDYGELKSPTMAVENGKIVFKNIGQGTKLHYTTDGSIPNTKSPTYSKPIPLYDGTLRYFLEAGRTWLPIYSLTVTKQGNVFDDVFTWDWYFDEVDTAVTLGIFDGVGGYSFAPKTGLTRAMFVTILYRLMQMNGKNVTTTGAAQFEDLTQSWYKQAVAWASENGIVNGYEDGTFRPDRVITREEMCVVLDRTLQWLNWPVQNGEAPFSDRAAISPWALQSVDCVSNAGLITGTNGYFAPLGMTTRAQAATVMLRLNDLLK